MHDASENLPILPYTTKLTWPETEIAMLLAFTGPHSFNEKKMLSIVTKSGHRETIRTRTRALRGLFTCVRAACMDVYICTHHVVCKVRTAVHCNDAVFHCNERQKENVCVSIHSKSHTDSGTPSHCVLPVHRLPCKAFPGSRRLHLHPAQSPICLLSLAQR